MFLIFRRIDFKFVLKNSFVLNKYRDYLTLSLGLFLVCSSCLAILSLDVLIKECTTIIPVATAFNIFHVNPGVIMWSFRYFFPHQNNFIFVGMIIFLYIQKSTKKSLEFCIFTYSKYISIRQSGVDMLELVIILPPEFLSAYFLNKTLLVVFIGWNIWPLSFFSKKYEKLGTWWKPSESKLRQREAF